MKGQQASLRNSLILLGALAVLPMSICAQEPALEAPTHALVATTPTYRIDSTYSRPTQGQMFQNYVFDAFGPYPLTTSLLMAGIDQADDSPPEWHQGMRGYTRRFGSEFGSSAVSTTVHFALAQTFREDTLYYRCECTGILPRARHALVSTLTARHGDSKRAVFSFSALAAPYAGTMTEVFGWYPRRYGLMDAFRMGNYSLLSYAGANLGLEFRPVRASSWIHRLHFDNTHGIAFSGTNP